MANKIKFVRECVEKYRAKLLDTSKRNSLISFNHSERSRQHIRIIDELPDFLYGQLLDGKTFTFLPLPEEDQIPPDEKTDEFRRRLEQAKLTDEEYRETIDAVDEDQEGALDKIKQIDRELRNKIRQELGLPVWDGQKSLSNSELAKKHDLNPSYEMPLPTPEDHKDPERHTDKFIQTLLRPEEMSRKLSGLASCVKSDIDESGVNTLYMAFGFLQWYESENSDKACTAPLLLLQLEIEKKQSNQGYIYKVQATGEEPEINLSLSERLKQDFGFALPDFTGEDSPEAYMEKVANLVQGAKIPKKDKWRVRRFITAGRFRFARLVMFHDLNPAKWPGETEVASSDVVQGLFSGSEDSGDGDNAEDYDIDTQEVENTVPLLITSADASQHSALVDVMKGNNLAIKGPPGTGKSQTITNIIACALAKGKTVLFLAEKMAALNVVHDRLSKADLGPYCLELHSTKAKKAEILKSIEERLKRRSSKPKGDLAAKIREFKKHRDHITEYIDILNSKFGRQNKTVHDYLWGAQLRKERTADLPNTLRQVRIPYDQANLSEEELSSHTDDLKLIQELKKEIDKDTGDGIHPWAFVHNFNLNPFQQDELKQLSKEWKEQIERLLDLLNAFENQYGCHLDKSLAGIGKLLQQTETLSHWNVAQIDIDLLARIGTASAASDFTEFVDNVHAYKEALEKITTIQNVPAHLNEIKEIEAAIFSSQRLCVQDKTASEIKKKVRELEEDLKLWEKNLKILFEVGKALGLSKNEDFGQVADLAEIPGYIASIPREYLLYRTKDIVDETNAERLNTACEVQEKIQTTLKNIEELYDLSLLGAPHEIRTDAAIIEGVGFFSIFDPAYRKAKRVYKLACKNKIKFDPRKAAETFREIAETKDSQQKIEQDVQLKAICGSNFQGIDTDFRKLQRINEWASEVRKRYAGPSEFLRNVRHWLLNADMDEMDSVRELADDPGFTALKSRIIDTKETVPPETSVRTYLDDMVNQAEKLNDLCGKLNKYAAGEKYSFVDIANDLPRLEKVNESKATAESNSVVKKLLGDTYKGAETNIQDFDQTARFVRDCLGIESVKELIDQFFKKDFAKIWKEYISNRAEIQIAYVKVSDLAISLGNQGHFPEMLAFSDLASSLEKALENPDSLNYWVEFNSHVEKAKSNIKADLVSSYISENISFETLPMAFEYVIYSSIAREIYNQYPQIKRFNGHSLDQARARIKDLDEEMLELQREELCNELNKARPLSGIGTGRKSSWTEGALIHNELSKQKRHIPIRDLMRRAGTSIQKVKPCFLMSPLTVAQYLQPGQFHFDLVVIDEASQMRPEDALGGVARGAQIVVVGDPQQLPPTSFFQSAGANDDDDEEDFIADAIMDMALSSFRPARILSRHYRSQHESLIAFSNYHFYDRNLILFPSPIKNPEELGVRLEYVGGTYAANSNMDEVQTITQSALDFMRKYPDRSLGIATMNQVQKDLIESEMDRAFIEHPHAAKYKAKWQGTLESFFVKNLESVQGDERDAIFISTVYGPDKNGTVMQRFGPINRAGGYRRLNVLFTRAKKNMVVFTSLKPEDIKVSESSSEGLRAFRGFLAFASKGVLDEGRPVSPDPDSDFEIWVKERLESIGCEVHPQVGVAGYRIDLGVKHPKYPYGYLLGIECDGATYHSSKSARERDIIRQQVLENLGWRIYRIWSTDWFSNPVQELEKLKIYIERLLASDDLPMARQDDDEHKVIEYDFRPDEEEKEQDDLFEHQPPASLKPEERRNVVELFDNVTYRMIKEGGKQEKRSAQIVPTQGDPNSGTIGQHSAVGRALLGNQINDEVEAILPVGEITLIIDEIIKSSNRSDLRNVNV